MAPLPSKPDCQNSSGLSILAVYSHCVQRAGRLLAELRGWFKFVSPGGPASLTREDIFQLVLEVTNDAIWDWDLESDSRWWSDSFFKMLGYEPGEIPNADWWPGLMHPHDQTRVVAGIQAAFDCNEHSWADEYRVRRKDGSYAYILDRGYVVYNPMRKPVRMVGGIVDISQRKWAEQELKELSNRMLEAQEAEKSRVARELHDGVNQILSAAKYRVHFLEQKLVENPALKEHSRKARDLLDQAFQEVRLISRNLRPSELDDLGLLAALRTACEEFGLRTGISPRLDLRQFPEALAPELELGIYRIIQEALANIEKHADATESTVRLARDGLNLNILIRDNGRGFDPDQARACFGKGGLGILNMKERAAFFGGSVTISGAPKRGTDVIVRIPMFPEL